MIALVGLSFYLLGCGGHRGPAGPDVPGVDIELSANDFVTLTLVGGRSIAGKIQSWDHERIVILTGNWDVDHDEPHSIAWSDIVIIEKTEPDDAASVDLLGFVIVVGFAALILVAMGSFFADPMGPDG
jgi:hypothetical protein